MSFESVGTANSPTPTQPVADLLGRGDSVAVEFPAPGKPQLVGSRCNACGTLAIPERFVCGTCASTDLARTTVGSAGTLYSYATVHVSSSRDTPYTLGYVDLDAGPRLLATIVGAIEALTPDARVELVEDDLRYVEIRVYER